MAWVNTLPKKQWQRQTRKYWKPNKYGARKCMVGEHVFDSAKEAARYRDLKQQEVIGLISELELQPEFVLQDGFEHDGKRIRAIKYIADFQYIRDGKKYIEDTKGFKTDVYRLKKKLLLHKHPYINFIET